MNAIKPFKNYVEQVDLLKSRGMCIEDHDKAIFYLKHYNYYRLSGYWYPMRYFDKQTNKPLDKFRVGASFDIVMQLYKFDEELRHTVFSELVPIELFIRTMLGHELGKINPLIHLDVSQLSAYAKSKSKKDSNKTIYDLWFQKYQLAVKSSKEDFVLHHIAQYGGKLPIWVAVELMDWGMLSHLYVMAPLIVQKRIATQCELSIPQFSSWLKSLNVLRNYTAHNARLFNRVYDIKPKLPKDMQNVFPAPNRMFGQLTLVQYLHRHFQLSDANCLPELLAKYPDNLFVKKASMGIPEDFYQNQLWNIYDK